MRPEENVDERIGRNVGAARYPRAAGRTLPSAGAAHRLWPLDWRTQVGVEPLTSRQRMDFTAQRQQGYAVHTYRSLLCGRATYLAAHLELGRDHHRTAGRQSRVWPRGRWRAALVLVTAGWHHRVLGSTMAPMWPLAGTAACRGLNAVARGDGPARGDLRPGGPRLACNRRGRSGLVLEASAASLPRWRSSFVPSCWRAPLG